MHNCNAKGEYSMYCYNRPRLSQPSFADPSVPFDGALLPSSSGGRRLRPARTPALGALPLAPGVLTTGVLPEEEETGGSGASSSVPSDEALVRPSEGALLRPLDA